MLKNILQRINVFRQSTVAAPQLIDAFIMKKQAVR